MVDPTRLVAFALAVVLLVLVPGPSVLFIVSRGVAQGRRVALATVLGNTGGLFVQAMAVALGLGAIVARSIVVFSVLKLAGAAYLVWLGIRTWRDRRGTGRVDLADDVPVTFRQATGEGFVVGVSNPKTIVFLSAILPQFVVAGAGSATSQLLVLGMVFATVALVCDSGWALLAGTARTWFAASPRRLQRLTGAGAAVMVGLGLRLAVTGRAD